VTVAVEDSEVDRFRAAIAQHLGLEIDADKRTMLAELLRQRLRETGSGGAAAYLRGLDSPAMARGEARILAEQLTVGETYFFRHADSLRAFIEVAAPASLGRVPGRLRILSAGCSSGEELYSLAMILREHRGALPAGEVTLLGIDVNPAVLRKAREGRYSSWSLRETPAHLRARYFRAVGAVAELDPEVRAMALFEERNLIHDDASFFHPGAFDAIFCRNVTIYFSPETTRRVIARLTRALIPGGYLFLGHSENLRGVSDEFHLCQSHGTFYYRRRDAEPRPAPPWTPRPPDERSSAADERPSDPDDRSWIDTIERAAARIARLTDEPPPAAPAAAAPAPPDLAPVLACLYQERFAEALALLGQLPTGAQRAADVQLLRAVALAHAGRLADAEEVCRDLLTIDTLNAGAHYVMALCREGAGDRSGAAHHDQTAISLAPGFAMPHLHLGLLAKKDGDRDGARRALEMAMGLLASEDAARILLFGGGFNRETLTQLCRSELRASGGGR
jgi:chemotaxis protein methyltransferase CheR